MMKRTPLVLGIGIVVGIILALAGVALVDDDPAQSPPSRGEPDELTASECGEIVSRDVVDALGWKSGRHEVEMGWRCTFEADAGRVTLNDTAIVAREAARADEAKKVFDEACGTLGEDVQRDVGWLGTDSSTCLRTELRAGRGQAELYLLTDGDEVVRIHVSMREQTTQDKLRAGLGKLVVAAEAHY